MAGKITRIDEALMGPWSYYTRANHITPFQTIPYNTSLFIVTPLLNSINHGPHLEREMSRYLRWSLALWSCPSCRRRYWWHCLVEDVDVHGLYRYHVTSQRRRQVIVQARATLPEQESFFSISTSAKNGASTWRPYQRNKLVEKC